MTEICPDCGRPKAPPVEGWWGSDLERDRICAKGVSGWNVDESAIDCNLAELHLLRARIAPLTRLEAWARKDEARYFEIRFISESPHPWAVELNNDEFGWSAVADCHDELEDATDHAFGLALVEEAKDPK